MAYFALYFVGFNFLRNENKNEGLTVEEKNQTHRSAYLLLLAVALGSYGHYILNFIINFGRTDIGRNTYDVWSGKIMAATGQATLSCLVIGVAISMALLPQKTSHIIYGFAILISVLSYNMVLAGRTLIAIMGLVFAAAFMFLWTSGALRKNKKGISILIVLILILALLFAINAFGLKDWFESSNLYNRFSDSDQSEMMETSRGGRKSEYIKNFFNYPFGGANMRKEFGYAHDLLLDSYDEYGMLVFVLLICILWIGTK